MTRRRRPAIRDLPARPLKQGRAFTFARLLDAKRCTYYLAARHGLEDDYATAQFEVPLFAPRRRVADCLRRARAAVALELHVHRGGWIH